MAILSKKELPTGIVLNYHKISSISVSYETSICTCVMSSYIDETARRNNKAAVETRNIQLSFTPETIPDNIRKAFYDLICTVPEPVDMTQPPVTTQTLYWLYPDNTAC